MEDGTKRVLAFVIMAVFVMVMIIPAVSASLSFWTWFTTLLIVVIGVPLVLWFALGRSRKEVQEYEGELLDWRGYNADEWAEERDPDDFEGEVD
jgi:fatty acid desaturase